MRNLTAACCGIVALLGVTCALAQEQPAAFLENRATPSSECVSFDGHSGVVEIRNEVMDKSLIVLNGIRFQSKTRLSNSNDDVLWIGGYGFGRTARLSFPPTGVEMLFPRLAASVTFELLEGNGPITVRALDSDGNLLDAIVTNFGENRANSMGMVHFTQIDFSIAKIELLDGGREGGIVFVCAIMKS